jgi:hypothetical protein
MNKPTFAKVGIQKYQILFLDDKSFNLSLTNSNIPLEDAINVESYIDYNHSLIYVREDLSVLEQKQHLLHEIIHGLIDDGAGEILLKDREDFTEKFVCLLSPRLHQFLAENNDLLNWIVSS